MVENRPMVKYITVKFKILRDENISIKLCTFKKKEGKPHKKDEEPEQHLTSQKQHFQIFSKQKAVENTLDFGETMSSTI